MTLKLNPNILVVIALFISSYPLIIYGFPMGHDSYNEILRVAEYKNSLLSHQYPPFWSNNFYKGYGSPIFLYYAPLNCIISSAISLYTESITNACVVTYIVFTIIAAFGMFYLTKEVLNTFNCKNKSACRISIYFYILSPYLLADKLYRIAIAEYIALCIVPFTIYSILLIKKAHCKGVLILSLSFSLVILAHNLTALTTAFIILSITLISISEKKTIYNIIFSITLGLAISSFFWIPSLYYMELIRLENLTSGKFYFNKNFITPLDIFNNSKFYSAGVLSLWVIVKTLTIITGKKYKAKIVTLFCLYFLLFFIYIQTKLSYPFWEYIPYLKVFQFPWRMMGPLSLIISILSALVFVSLYKTSSSKKNIKIEVILLLLCIINALPQLTSASGLTAEEVEMLNNIVINHKIKEIPLDSTENNEYLPKTASLNIINESNSGIITNLDPTSILKKSGTEIIFNIFQDKTTNILIPRWYFPGWSYKLNGEKKPLLLNNDGTININIPAGNNIVKLNLSPPPIRAIFTWVSLTSFLLWIALAIKICIKKNAKEC